MEHIEPKNSPGSKQQIESIHTIRIVNSSEVIPLFKRSNNSQPFTDSGPSNSLGDFGDLGHLDARILVGQTSIHYNPLISFLLETLGFK